MTSVLSLSLISLDAFCSLVIPPEIAFGGLGQRQIFVGIYLNRWHRVVEIIRNQNHVAFSFRCRKICQQEVTVPFPSIGVAVSGEIVLETLDQLLPTRKLRVDLPDLCVGFCSESVRGLAVCVISISAFDIES